MRMPKPVREIKISIILIIAAVLMLGTSDLLDANSSIDSPTHSQTVPTRTPKPPGPSPSRAPGLSPPTPTQTEIPPTATVRLVLTPQGGFNPTAVPCTEPPTAQALDTVNVRAGPGLEYEVVEQLVFLEVRPIVGRSQFVPWWLIELRDISTGWVIDEAVAASGYIGNVPVADSDSVGDQTPVPTSTWAPTVEPQCTPLPTHTVTPTPTMTPTQETAGPEITQTATESPVTEEIQEKPTEELEQETPLPTEAPISPTPEKTESIDVSQDLVEDNVPVSETASEGFNFNVLLFIGLGFTLVGIVLYLGRRFTS